MLINSGSPSALNAYNQRSFAPKSSALSSNIQTLAPGDVYVPSQPNAPSLIASGAGLGAIAGLGLAAVATQSLQGIASTALGAGIVVATAIGGGFLANMLAESVKAAS